MTTASMMITKMTMTSCHRQQQEQQEHKQTIQQEEQQQQCKTKIQHNNAT